MIGNPVSLIVRKHFERPDIEKLKMFQGVATGFVVDAQNGTGALDRKIKPVDPEMKFAGPAMTADAEPRDYLPVQPAIALAKPGDVLVIATGGYEGAAVIGDNVAMMAKNQGLAAIVTDGLVRDIEGVLAAGIPVFCCGVSPNSPYARGPGRVTQAMGVTGALQGHRLTSPPLALESGWTLSNKVVRTSGRIGVTKATDWPYRFYVHGARGVSRHPVNCYRGPPA